jgi:hypothetical protein
MTLEEIADRKRREFLPNAPAGIEGEAGILTGAIGAGMNGRSDELLSTNERTAKATEAQLKAAQTLNDKIDQLIAALRGGALGVVPSTP